MEVANRGNWSAMRSRVGQALIAGVLTAGALTACVSKHAGSPAETVSLPRAAHSESLAGDSGTGSATAEASVLTTVGRACATKDDCATGELCVVDGRGCVAGFH